MSNFPFVSDQILKTNLDVVFDHIGGLKDLEKEYTREDIEFCFNVAKRVKEICQK